MEGLKIEIGANIQDALNKVEKLGSGLGKLEKESVSVGRALSAIPASLKPIDPAAFKQLGDAIARLKMDIAGTGKALGAIPASLKPINPAGIKALSEAVNRLKTDIAGTGASLANMGKGAGNGLKPIPAAAGEAATAINKLKPGSDQAANALQNLGRIAQDAPFGFIGISNNINPLLESFQRLKASTGTTGGALKALAGSMMGAGGIGLAISVATGLLVVFGDRLFKTKDAAEKLTKEQKKAAEEMQRIADAERSSAESLGRQLETLNSLVRVATSDVSSKKQQADALTKLNELIPDNVGKLTSQNIKMAEGVGVIKKYTEALIAQANAQLFLDKIATEAGVKFESEQKTNKELATLGKERAKVEQQINDLVNKGGKSRLVFLSKLRPLQDQQAALLEKEAKLLNDNAKIQIESDKKSAQYRTQIDKGTTEGIQIEIKDPKKAKEAEDALAKSIAQLKEFGSLTKLVGSEKMQLLTLEIQMAIRDQDKDGLDANQLQRKVDALIKENNVQADVPIFLVQRKVNDLMKVTDGFNVPAIPVKLELIKGAKEAINTELATQDLPLVADVEIKPKLIDTDIKKGVNELMMAIESAVESAAVGLAEAIGDALGGQNAGNIMQGFVTILADGLIQIGKVAIGIGIGMEAIRDALNTINPGVALAAGIALVALGTAAKAAIQGQAKKFATGGIVTGPTNAIIGEGGQPEVIFPLRDLNKFIGNIRKGDGAEGYIAETNISGDHLNILLRRSNNRFGGSLS